MAKNVRSNQNGDSRVGKPGKGDKKRLLSKKAAESLEKGPVEIYCFICAINKDLLGGRLSNYDACTLATLLKHGLRALELQYRMGRNLLLGDK